MNKFAVKLHERSVAKLLHKLNFSSITVRPLHPKTDLAAQDTFKKALTVLFVGIGYKPGGRGKECHGPGRV